MTRAYFVSDLHLTTAEDPRTRLFERFLDDVAGDQQATHLFLLGDIFDLWIGSHDYFAQRFQRIVSAIDALRRRGIEIHYFEGNHDLHLQQFWEEKLSVNVHPGPISIEIAGRRLRLEHGDQMDPDDRGYIFLRWLLRMPQRRTPRHRST